MHQTLLPIRRASCQEIIELRKPNLFPPFLGLRTNRNSSGLGGLRLPFQYPVPESIRTSKLRSFSTQGPTVADYYSTRNFIVLLKGWLEHDLSKERESGHDRVP